MRFISEGVENGKRRRSRGFPSALPKLGWMVSSRSKPSWLAPRPAGSPSPLVQQGRDGYAKQGWVWGGRLWGRVALQSLSLERLLSDPTPPHPD